MEEQWAKSANKIKENIRVQDRVIYSRADFSKVELHRHVVDGRIEDIPVEEDDKANLEFDHVNPEAGP